MVGAAAGLQPRPAELGLDARRLSARRRRPSRRRSCAAVDLPVLLIGTERDRLVSPAAIRGAAALLPRAELEMYPDAAPRNPARGRSGPAAMRSRRIDAFLDGHARGEPTRRRRDRRRRHGRGQPGRRDRRRRRAVLILEAESQPGYHSTGRSAAFWSESYGGPLIQPLTSASGRFLAAPPADFRTSRSCEPRGAVHLADAGGRARARRACGASSPARRSSWSSWTGRRSKRPYAGLQAGLGLRAWPSRAAPTSTSPRFTRPISKRARARGARAGRRRPRRAARARRRSTGGSRPGPGSSKPTILVNAAGAWADEVAAAAGERAARHPALSPDHRPAARSIRRRRPTCRWSSMRASASISSRRPAAGSGSARTTRRLRARATARPRRSTSPSPSTGWSRWSTGGSSGSSAAGPACGASRPTGCRSTASRPARRDFFWCAGQGGFGIQTAPAAAAAGRRPAARDRAPRRRIDPAPYLAERFADRSHFCGKRSRRAG